MVSRRPFGFVGAIAAVWLCMLACGAGAQQGNSDAWLDIDRPAEEAICFTLYTVHGGTLKLTAQLYPLADGVGRSADLQIDRDGRWVTMARVPIDASPYGGPLGDLGRWTAHFRLRGWDHSRDWRYRVVAADGRATYEGVIRRDPVDKDEIVVASLSCNSNEDRGLRDDIVRNLLAQDPDLLFFAGDQVYDHRHHLQSWLAFGRQFGELTRSRPTVTIPDDHDVGQSNLWGESGGRAATEAGNDGGYFMDPRYVNSVQRAQTWHLPDPYDATPVRNGIGVYYTSLRVGGVDFAILEDRKFKTAPNGAVPEGVRRAARAAGRTGDAGFDGSRVDIPGAKLLGDRQLAFVRHWGQDWSGVSMKAVLSQTIFGHIGQRSGPWIGNGGQAFDASKGGRLLIDYDSNGWPQSARNRALEEIRRAFAVMLCGDQHLPAVAHLGVDAFRDAGVAFASPAIMNVWPRRWEPFRERVGAGPADPLLGDHVDGLGNRVSMLAYANATRQPDPDDPSSFGGLAEGYGLVRFNTRERTVTMECWPRSIDVTAADAWQYEQWPITVTQDEQYGRAPTGWLPRIEVRGVADPVVQVVHDATGELLYTKRWQGSVVEAHTFADGAHTVRVGEQPGGMVELTGLLPVSADERGVDDRDSIVVRIGEDAEPWPAGVLIGSNESR